MNAKVCCAGALVSWEQREGLKEEGGEIGNQRGREREREREKERERGEQRWWEGGREERAKTDVPVTTRLPKEGEPKEGGKNWETSGQYFTRNKKIYAKILINRQQLCRELGKFSTPKQRCSEVGVEGR